MCLHERLVRANDAPGRSRHSRYPLVGARLAVEEILRVVQHAIPLFEKPFGLIEPADVPDHGGIILALLVRLRCVGFPHVRSPELRSRQGLVFRVKDRKGPSVVEPQLQRSSSYVPEHLRASSSRSPVGAPDSVAESTKRIQTGRVGECEARKAVSRCSRLGPVWELSERTWPRKPPESILSDVGVWGRLGDAEYCIEFSRVFSGGEKPCLWSVTR